MSNPLQQYRIMFDQMAFGAFFQEADGSLVAVNQAALEMLGLSRDQFLGRTSFHPEWSVINGDGTDLPPEQHPSMVALRTGKQVSDFVAGVYNPLRQTITWLNINATPMFRDGEDTPYKVFTTLSDITGLRMTEQALTDLTGRKEAEIALQQANDELEKRVVERTAALAKAKEQIKLISFQLVRAQEQERARIAGELHDQVGQSLLLAKMKLDMFISEISPARERNSSAVDISTLLETCIHDIRTLTFGMHPPLLETAGMEAAIEWLCDSIRNDYQLQMEFSYNCRQLSFGAEMRYSVYQAVRELLLNVAKHAGVNRAELSLQTEKDQLVVRVADAGSGFDHQAVRLGHPADSGFGLFNVRQRIEQMGGSFVVVSAPGLGTVVTLTIPLADN